VGDLLGRGSRPASTGRRLAVYGAGATPARVGVLR
jgi:hypothetical protein